LLIANDECCVRIADFTPVVGKMTTALGDRSTSTERIIPPYNGFGSDDDSLGNCLSLIPKPPRRNFAQFMELDKAGYDGHVLRFLARLQQAGPDPTGVAEQRRFIVCYFLADGTVSVFEQSAKNAGTHCTVLRFCRPTQCVGAAFAMATWLSVCHVDVLWPKD